MLKGIKRSFSGVSSFFSGSVYELKKVRWPSRAEMVNYTLVVLATVFVVTVFLFVVDLVIGQVVHKLISHKAG